MQLRSTKKNQAANLTAQSLNFQQTFACLFRIPTNLK